MQIFLSLQKLFVMPNDNTNWKKPKEIESQHLNVMLEIGSKLEKLRINKGMTASGLAKELGISRNSYSQMERGEIYFSTYNFLKVLDFHGVDLSRFFNAKIDEL